MSVETRLQDLKIQLPEAPAAVAAYKAWVRVGNQIVTSGQLPWRDGELAFPGKLGAELSEDEGYQAARQGYRFASPYFHANVCSFRQCSDSTV